MDCALFGCLTKVILGLIVLALLLNLLLPSDERPWKSRGDDDLPPPPGAVTA